MIKQAPSLRQIAFMVGFAVSCFALLLGLWLSFGGSAPLQPKGYRIHVLLPDAAQLAVRSDVRISGVTIGKVVSLRVDPRANATDATLEIDSAFAPRPRDTRALVRQKTLLGETYLALSPGSARSSSIPENGTLASRNVQHAVTFGDVLSTFDAPARRSFGIWMVQQGASLAETGPALNDTVAQLDPFARRTDTVMALVAQEREATRRFVSAGGVTLRALTAQPGRLRALVRSTDAAFAATARQDRQLAATVRALGPFLTQSRLTLDRLARFSHDTRPLTERLVPVAHALRRVLRDGPGSAVPLRTLLDAAPALDRASLPGVPATVRVLRRSPALLASLRTYLAQLIPFLDYTGKYRRELTATLGNVAAATQATLPGAGAAKPLHLLRAVAALNPESLAAYPARLQTDRSNPYLEPGAFRGLSHGLPSWPTGCGNAALPALSDLVSPEEQARVERFFFTDRPRNVACLSQAPLGPHLGHGTEALPLLTALP